MIFEDPEDRLIVPLDVFTLEEAVSLVRMLKDHVGCFKVGMQLLNAVGTPRVVRALHNLGVDILIDEKFNDKPNTVGKVVRAVAKQNVMMMTVHASSGMDAMIAAAENKLSSIVLGVSVLTSHDEATCQHIFNASVKDKVLQFARDANKAGLDGVICSPQELVFLREQNEFADFLMVTPGIRLSGDDANDQKRIMTPKEAILSGADMIVVGKSITNSLFGTPVNAAKHVVDQIAEGLAERKNAA